MVVLEEGEVLVGEVAEGNALEIVKIAINSVVDPLARYMWEETLSEKRKIDQSPEGVHKQHKPTKNWVHAKPFRRIGRFNARKTRTVTKKLLKTLTVTVKETVGIYTMYKRKAQKVQPVDNLPSDGSLPEGDLHWRQKRWDEVKNRIKEGGKFDDLVTGKFSKIKEGTRLTADRLKTILADCDIGLLPEEELLLQTVLFNREEALAWDFNDVGAVHELVAPPQAIKTIEHKAWQAPDIPIPKPLVGKVIELLRERIARGVLEESHAAYRNSWFLVQKKDGGLRLINNATKINAVTARDAFIPPAAEELSEDFGMCAVLTLCDLFSGYDQVPLDIKSRDLTTFATPLGLLRMCTLPQGATNSVAQFMRIVVRILYDLIPDVCRAFLDELCIKGPTTRYDDKPHDQYPGLRKFIVEHIQNIDRVLLNCELAGVTIAAKKSQWCKKEAVIVGYLCGIDGCKLDQMKIRKILEWKQCDCLKDVCAFLGIVGFYRIWIEGYATTAEPLFRLMRKDTPFEWAEAQLKAMDSLKQSLTSPPILISLDYTPEGGIIILMTDASLTGWGAVLMQLKDGHRKPARFESGIWTSAEAKYDATKRECRGVLFALKRLRYYLYGVRFTLETDAKVLMYQLNGTMTDLPGALINRWITWIRSFDFEVKHISGAKNSVADGLSRKPATLSDMIEKEQEGDLQDFIDAQIMANIVTEADQAPIDLDNQFNWS